VRAQKPKDNSSNIPA